MKNTLPFFFSLLFLTNYSLAQPTFKIILIEGTAKIQKSTKKTWDNLKIGDEINDKDIIETFFETKVVLKYGYDNSIIIGSNSRVLLNIADSETKDINVNMTLFSGGALAKVISNSHVNIYTANAVAQTDSGTISTVVESKTGHTGFQVLGGSAKARNISQQQGNNLVAGLTTIVLPGKEPTAPLYITYRHVTVLKHFFGEEFIDHEINAAGIKPTEDVGSTNRLSFSQNLGKGRGSQEDQMHKKLFSHDRIYGVILEDQTNRGKDFIHISKPSRMFRNKGELHFTSSFASVGGDVYPYLSLKPSIYLNRFSFGLNLPIAKDYSKKMSMHFKSVYGIFDKVNFITIGNIGKSQFFKLGSINDLTMADGLIVNNFNNKSIYSVTQPLGMILKYDKKIFNINAFISDISNWYVGGFHFGLFPTSTWLGFGYYYDANQFKNTLTPEISRFIDIAFLDSLNPTQGFDKKSFLNKSSIHIYEVNLGYLSTVSEKISFDFLLQFACKMEKEYQYTDTLDQFENDTTKYITSNTKTSDFIIKGPEFRMKLDNFYFGISYLVETGKLTSPYFNSYYMSNRLRELPKMDQMVLRKYSETQNNTLDPFRRTYGFDGFFSMTPYKGIFIDIKLRHDFASHRKQDVTFKEAVITETMMGDTSILIDTINVNKDTTLFLDEKVNFGYSFSVNINDKLWKPIRYGRVYLNQINGGYFPKGGKYFSSWGFSTGLDLITSPLFLNLSFETGLMFTYIDIYNEYNVKNFLNNNIDNNDTAFEFYFGVRWGFL